MHLFVLIWMQSSNVSCLSFLNKLLRQYTPYQENSWYIGLYDLSPNHVIGITLPEENYDNFKYKLETQKSSSRMFISTKSSKKKTNVDFEWE